MTKMISVSVEISEGVFTRRVRVAAPSIELALKSAVEGGPDAVYASTSR